MQIQLKGKLYNIYLVFSLNQSKIFILFIWEYSALFSKSYS